MCNTRKRVLAVDDDEETREVLLDLFASLGHDVVCVGTGQAAIAAVGAERPDYIFIDVELPDMSGHEVARRLRSTEGAAMVIVALTALSREDDRRRSTDAGMDLHIVKPAMLGILRSLVGDADESPPPPDWAEGTGSFAPRRDP
jgi:two-component system, OmpR family, response regulator